VIVAPLGSDMLRLQCLGFSADDYRQMLRGWQDAGVLGAYRAHFLLDDVHWIWYSLFFTAVLCRLFERRAVNPRHDWILLLPLVSGLLDAFENRLQHVFLSTPDFSQVVDPLPAFSTVASDLKWGLVLLYVGVALALLAGIGTPAGSPTAGVSRRSP
jgi:hypothetical protein